MREEEEKRVHLPKFEPPHEDKERKKICLCQTHDPANQRSRRNKNWSFPHNRGANETRKFVGSAKIGKKTEEMRTFTIKTERTRSDRCAKPKKLACLRAIIKCRRKSETIYIARKEKDLQKGEFEAQWYCVWRILKSSSKQTIALNAQREQKSAPSCIKERGKMKYERHEIAEKHNKDEWTHLWFAAAMTETPTTNQA